MYFKKTNQGLARVINDILADFLFKIFLIGTSYIRAYHKELMLIGCVMRLHFIVSALHSKHSQKVLI